MGMITMAMSHESCTHPRTPAGRAACRKAGGPGQIQINIALDVKLDDAFGPVISANRCTCVNGALGQPHLDGCGAVVAKNESIKPVMSRAKARRAGDAMVAAEMPHTAVTTPRRRSGRTRDLDVVSVADMPRVFRTVMDWAATHELDVKTHAGRNDQVQIYVTSIHGEACFVYARATPDGVNSTSFRPARSSVGHTMTVNEALARLLGKDNG